jgi:nuclear pore complex protein Nup54
LVLHVLERQNDGNVRRISAVDLHAFLVQPQQKANLQAMSVEDVQAKLSLTKDMEKQYLEKVPPGLSSYMWYQAQRDNPDPENLLPVPLVGFEEMYLLLKKEEALATLSKDTCQQVGADVKKLERKVEENKQTALNYQEKLERLILRQLHVSLFSFFPSYMDFVKFGDAWGKPPFFVSLRFPVCNRLSLVSDSP